MKKIGLCLGGGGAKGAYQIGVWKYMAEKGWDKNICAISGSSIGALNMLLFAQSDVNRAEQLWRTIRVDDILASEQSGLLTTIKRMVQNRDFHIFNQERVAKVIEKGVQDWDAISQSSIPLYACVAQKKRNEQIQIHEGTRPRDWIYETKYIELNQHTKEEIKDIVLASSAMPIIYPTKQIKENDYVDGGFLDNNPVRPLVELGLKEIVVVHLFDWTEDEKSKWELSIEGLDTDDIVFHHISPSEPFNFIDAFVVNKVLTMGRIQLGYEDAKECLQIKD